MKFRAMMKKAVAKMRLVPCVNCRLWPCACHEIEARIAEQLKLWKDAHQPRPPEKRRTFSRF